MDWLTITPPIVAIIVAVWTRNVFWALGLAIWLSETIIAGFNPFMGALGGIDRAVGVFDSPYNTRVLLFCLIIGALIVCAQCHGSRNHFKQWTLRAPCRISRWRSVDANVPYVYV